MNDKLQRQLDLLESSKSTLLEKLKHVDSEKLKQKPNEKSWSILQIVSHLIKIEQGTMKYMKKKLSYDPPLKKTGPLTAFKIWVAKLLMKLPVRFNTTHFLEEPTNAVNLEDASEEWARTREEMLKFLGQLSDEQLSAGLHKNLAAGRVNAYQQLSFIQVHFDRHVKQIDHLTERFE